VWVLHMVVEGGRQGLTVIGVSRVAFCWVSAVVQLCIC